MPHLLLSALHAAAAAEGGLAGSAADWVWLTIALPFLGFLLNGLIAFRRPQARTAVSVIGAGVLLAAFAVALAVFAAVRGAHPDTPYVVRLWSWLPVGSLQIDIALQVDQLSLVMLLVVTGVGSLIHLFSIGYMREDEGYARYFSYLNLFVAFMLILVLGSSFPVMFIGWEGVGLCSYLLIGFWYGVKANADAGKKAFIVNRIGDFGFLIAMFLLWNAVGTLEFTGVFARAPGVLSLGGGLVTAITLFLMLGCAGKSAQIPLYVWLPDAMAGPTPVSALIHAATMVTAGVYLVARCNVLFALAPTSSMITAGIGALTALFAATIGLRQYDIKKVLAYSTVSQLGYMFLGVGTLAFSAGIFHLVTHAFFKALLFLGSGSVIHAMHHAYHATHSHEDAQDMRNMGGLRQYMPWTFWLMLIATLAIAGVPPFSGFFSKDEILAAAFARGATQPWYYVFYALGLIAAALTAFYMARLMAMTFFGENRTGETERQHLHEAPWIMTGPLVVLGVLSLIGGVLNLPAIVGGHSALHQWLHPVLAGSALLAEVPELPHNTELLLLGVAIVVAIAGLIAGHRATLAEPILPAAKAPPERGFARVLFRKYYVDEIYDALIIRPLVWLSRVVLWQDIDQKGIDGAGVNGAARVARFFGRAGSALQSGYVGAYVIAFLAGALWILFEVMK
ncbi:MAG: NADH-quinone oxidoreductase subunit L [Gemmatimonadales bacterium]